MADQLPKGPPKLSQSNGAFVRRKMAAKKAGAKDGKPLGPDHGFDARNYHQNANRHGIHALTTFDCPICHCKNTIRVELDTKNRTAVVKCTYCVSLKPRPVDLPYPFTTTYVPRLENRADAFFKFSEAYRKLVLLQSPEGHSGVGTSGSSGSGAGGSSSHGGTSQGESGNHDEDGLLGGLEDILAQATGDGLDTVLDQRKETYDGDGEDEGNGVPREEEEENSDGEDEADAERKAKRARVDASGGVAEDEEDGSPPSTPEAEEEVVDDVADFFQADD